MAEKPSGASCRVVVETLAGRTLELELPQDANVADLHSAVMEELANPSASSGLQLIMGDTEVMGGGVSLTEAGIEDGACLTAVLRDLLRWDTGTASSGGTVSDDGEVFTRDKGVENIRATAGFTRGIHTWEIEVTAPSGTDGIRLGIVDELCDVGNHRNAIGNDPQAPHSFGLMGAGKGGLYGRLCKQGEKFGYVHGDVIVMQLDLNARTLSAARRGEELVVIGTDLPEDRTFFPAASVYSPAASVRLARAS